MNRVLGMKYLIIKIFFFIMILNLISCDSSTINNGKIYWEGDNLYIEIFHPTYGIVGFNKIGWRGAEPDEILDNVLKQLKRNHSFSNANIWVRFKYDNKNKYGDDVYDYKDYYLTQIPLYEAKKYKNSKYLDKNYHIKDLIIQAAFGDLNEDQEINTLKNRKSNYGIDPLDFKY